MVHEEISRRYQRINEGISTYLGDMKRLFSQAVPPYGDDHKIFLVKKNMRAEYIKGLAIVQIKDFEHLCCLCKQIEESEKLIEQKRSAYLSNRSVPARNQQDLLQRNIYRNSDQHRSNEVLELREARTTGRTPDRRTNPRRNGIRAECWNCGRVGHRYARCPQPPLQLFCCLCGEPGVSSVACPRGHSGKNSAQGTNSGTIGQPDSIRGREHRQPNTNPFYSIDDEAHIPSTTRSGNELGEE